MKTIKSIFKEFDCLFQQADASLQNPRRSIAIEYFSSL